jgi:hypothetical protein
VAIKSARPGVSTGLRTCAPPPTGQAGEAHAALEQQNYWPALLANNLTRDHTAIAAANLHPHLVARSSGSVTMAYDTATRSDR